MKGRSEGQARIVAGPTAVIKAVSPSMEATAMESRKHLGLTATSFERTDDREGQTLQHVTATATTHKGQAADKI